MNNKRMAVNIYTHLLLVWIQVDYKKRNLYFPVESCAVSPPTLQWDTNAALKL